MKCETCGKEFFEDWRKDKKWRKTAPCRFCCRACSNKKSHSVEQNRKVSEAVKKAHREYEIRGCICQKCGAVFHTKDRSRRMCFECLPKTIKRNTKNRVKPKIVSILDASKRTACKILARMNLPCSCCGAFVKGVNWDVHHIIPKRNGGSDDMANLTYICPNCHRIAHTDPSLLCAPLVPLVKQLENSNKNWMDFYYG